MGYCGGVKRGIRLHSHCVLGYHEEGVLMYTAAEPMHSFFLDYVFSATAVYVPDTKAR